MGARRRPKPSTGTPASVDQVYEWLLFLCLNTKGRGLGGSELLDCPELLAMRCLATRAAIPNSLTSRAAAIRQLLAERFPIPTDRYRPPEPNLATRHLLGLSPASERQARPRRRELCADALGLLLDTSQKHYERTLLWDAAEILWEIEERS